jgi:hypothetical protein
MGSTGAILLHSPVDSNMYLPANVLAIAWILGVGMSREAAISE